MSETAVGKLAEALAKAQAEIRDAPRDRQNPFFNSKYATLSSVWEVIREPLTKNGLAVLQAPSARMVDGRWVASVTTTLMHSSGEERAWTLEAPVPKPDVQGLGSALTYLRRYSLGAVGVASEEDDDGNAASQADKPAAKAKRERQEPPDIDASPRTPGAAPTTLPNYGKAKGALISGAPLETLEFYIQGARKSLADPSKAKFHAKEQALLDALMAEVDRQNGKSSPSAAPIPPHYAEAVKLGAVAGWAEENIRHWLKAKRGRASAAQGRASAAQTTAEDVEALRAHLVPPDDEQPSHDYPHGGTAPGDE